MKIHLQHIASVTVVATLLAGCVTESAPARKLNRIALITSGDTYFYGATRFGPEISVVEIDGKPVDKPYGPIELEPGAHAITMKCGDSITARKVTVAAGDIYQFAVVATPGVRGCAGSLSRVWSAGKSAAKSVPEPARRLR